jgi:SAM-dependent methyltransferase
MLDQLGVLLRRQRLIRPGKLWTGKAPIAQRIEHLPPKQGVPRSSRGRGAFLDWRGVDLALGAASIVEVMDTDDQLDHLLGEQAAYYRALSANYLEQVLDLPGGGELTEALACFQPKGSVLELACGPGVWTGQLLDYATDVTAVDASPEMLALAAARIGSDRVRFIQADLFTWRPDRRYDVVFMGFWLSHVPAGRFESFWSVVADCLKPEGRVFFADDAYRTPDELVEGPSSSTIRRQVPDGTAYRLVKVPHEPADLERRLQQLGWDMKVSATAGPFYWGAGSRGNRQARRGHSR